MLLARLDGRRIAGTREHQQTVLLRHQCAEVERLPVTGKPLTDVTITLISKEDQR